MRSLTTVVVVHATAAPDRPILAALCDEHTALLHRAARIDELVGFSTVMDCEACALLQGAASDAQGVAVDQVGRSQRLHAVPKLA
jgi:hypothetical protein